MWQKVITVSMSGFISVVFHEFLDCVHCPVALQKGCQANMEAMLFLPLYLTCIKHFCVNNDVDKKKHKLAEMHSWTLLITLVPCINQKSWECFRIYFSLRLLIFNNSFISDNVKQYLLVTSFKSSLYIVIKYYGW